MKRCASCGEEKPADAFSRDASRRDGRYVYCKACHKSRGAASRAKRIEHHRAVSRDYARLHRAQQREAAARYRERHPERVRDTYAAWRLRNLTAERARKRIRRGLDDVEYRAILEADPCAYCGGTADTVDHISPVVASGDGTWENLTAACKSCNSAKWAHPLLLFLLGRRR